MQLLKKKKILPAFLERLSLLFWTWVRNNWSSFLIINCPCSEAIAGAADNYQALRSHDKNNILTDHCQIKYKQTKGLPSSTAKCIFPC